MTYYISWLEDESKRAQITAAMDEAVAVYNATTNFDVNIKVIYSSGIPTAQAGYNGEIGFGGSISTTVAIHEIAHYLGNGSTWQWDGQFSGGVWNGAMLKHFVKNADGPWGEIYKAGVHISPYGFNYPNEDNPNARRRVGRLMEAMRFDMGLSDGDWDGMSDEWENYKIGTTSQGAAGDVDGDGISNRDEWLTEGDPLRACPVKHGHTYLIRARSSQKLMEVAGIETGANVRQNAPDSSDFQKWTAWHMGGGYWKFLNVASGKVLETVGGSNDAGANIAVWDDLGGDYQQWRIVPDGAIQSKIINKGSRNMVVDVDGGPNATGNLVNISQYYDNVGASNQAWTFEDVTPGEPTGALLQAEYKLDGTPRETSGNEFQGTASGDLTYATGRVDAQCATFNGTNASIKIPASVDTTFSIACWVKTTATAGSGQWYNGMGLVDGEVSGAGADFGLALVGNKIGFGVGNADYTLTTATAVNDGQWHHVVATRDNASGAMKIYIDGVQQASGTGPTGPRMSPSALRLGSIRGETGFFNGSLDEVRLYSGILSASEISSLADVGSMLVARYTFESNTLDLSNQGNHGESYDITYVPGRDGVSASQFNGTSSFVKIPQPVVSDFSVAYWVKTTATGGTGQWWEGKSMIDAEIPGNANDWGIALVGDKVGFGIGNPDTTITSSVSINDGVWHHVTATRQSGTIRIYVDGQLTSSSTAAPAAARNTPAAVRVGSSLYGGSWFAGAIDDLRFYNYSLTSTEVASLVGAPLPPSAPSGLTAVSGNGEVNLAWTASSGTTSYNVKRASTSGGPYTSVGTTSTNGYPDLGVTNGITYYYVVAASNAGGEGANSAEAIGTPFEPAPAPWVAADIGSVGRVGSTSYDSGVYTLNGSGSGITGTADAFQFVSQTLVGDGEIRARVVSQSNTNGFAKAGVMMRNGTSSGAANALVAVTPSNGFTFQSRGAGSGSTTSVAGPALNTQPNNWIRLVRSGTLFTSYVSANGTAWTQVGTATLTMGSSVSVGLAVTSTNNTVLSNAIFDNVAITPYPLPWTTADVGTTGLVGSAEYFGAAQTLKGAGSFGGATDGFRYVYQTLSADGSIIARIKTLQDTGTSARVGIMMRDSLATNSRMASLAVNGSGAWRWERRTTTGGSASTTNSSSGTSPNIWVRLVRSGNIVTASRSTNGTSWTTIGSVTVTMASNCYVGLAVASGSTTTLNTAVMDNITVVP